MTYTFEVDARRPREEGGYSRAITTHTVDIDADNEVDAELAACQIVAARHGMPIASRPIV